MQKKLLRNSISFILLLACIILLSGSADKFTTGPSSADATIIPVAYSWETGNILCKTHYYINEMGAHALLPEKYGWLVVNRNGLWEEYTHLNLPGEFGDMGYEDAEVLADKAKEEFDASFKLSEAPASVKPIIEKYLFNGHLYAPTHNRVFWTKDGIYNAQDSLLLDNTKLFAIEGLQNDGGYASSIGCAYYIDGVAFFNCYQTYEETNDDYATIGATFFNDLYDYGIELYQVTGVCFIPENE